MNILHGKCIILHKRRETFCIEGHTFLKPEMKLIYRTKLFCLNMEGVRVAIGELI